MTIFFCGITFSNQNFTLSSFTTVKSYKASEMLMTCSSLWIIW